MSGSPRNGLASIMRNFAWLAGGKGFAAVCSLIYLAVLSRSLGLKDFGHFSLIFVTAQTLVAVSGLATWQSIVRFGAPAVVERDWGRLARLSRLCAGIDLLSAAIGVMLAALVFFVFSGPLELNPAYVTMAFWFNCALIFARLSTPIGVVRVFERFDLGSYVEAVVPLGRLVASGVIVATGPSVGKFLLAWAAFDLLSGALYWAAAHRLIPGGLFARPCGRIRAVLDENPGILRFFGITWTSSIVDTPMRHGPLFAVSALVGTSAGGLYRMADQLAQGVKQASAMVARAIFPVFAITNHATPEGPTFMRLVRQVTLMGLAAGLAVTLAAIVLGETMLVAIGGASFAAAAPVLVPLALGTAFELASVSNEQMLYATDKAAAVLRARVVSLAVLGVGLLAVADDGPVSAGWAVAVAMAVFYVMMTVTSWLSLRQSSRQSSTESGRP